LRDLKVVEKHLPVDVSGTERGGFPVVLFKANVMFLKIDSDGSEALQIDLLDVGRRWFEDDLKLGVLVQAIGVFAIATVGGPTARLHIRDAVGSGAQDAEKGFGVHGSRADFDVVRLLENATLLHPEM